MTKSRTTRAGSLSRARLLLVPLDILPLNNDTTFSNHKHKHLRVHMHKSGAGMHPGDDTRTHSDRGTRATAPQHRQARRRARDAVVEELELRQRVCEMFSGFEKRHHGDLCRAQKRVRQPRMQGAAG